jgi:hypothetical protein
MRTEIVALLLVLAPWAARAAPPEAPSRFDGAWTTNVSCPDTDGAKGFTYDLPTTIENGVLHAERKREGEPGHLVIDGRVGPDGHAELYAKGVVGASQYAVGQAPAGTGYGYHVNALFQDASGTGRRVEGRHCDLTFTRQ